MKARAGTLSIEDDLVLRFGLMASTAFFGEFG
jgi:hypothetical protein